MFVLIILLFFATSAIAQDGQSEHRLNRLERDMLLLQKQIYRGEVNIKSVDGNADLSQFEIRLSNLEEEMRKLYGKIEQLEFQNQQLLQIIENKNQAINLAPISQPRSLAPARIFLNKVPDKSNPTGLIHNHNAVNANTPTPIVQEEDISTPELLYKKAFVFLSKRDLDKSRELMQEFIQKYPEHKLIENAYYWIGETYYVEKNYVDSVNYFKKGYEVMPKGHKAPDNLLKLGLSLDNLNKRKEACIIYDKLKSVKPAKFIAERLEKELVKCK